MPSPGFEDFVRSYQDMVYTTAIRLLGREAEAEDVAQETFLRAFEHFDHIGPSASAGGWLKTVATNLALNHLSRHRNRFRLFSELAEPDQDIEALAGGVADPDWEADETGALLEAALRALPDSQRVPLALFHFEDLDYAEIARKLDISLSKVKTDIFRGRAALRRALEGKV